MVNDFILRGPYEDFLSVCCSAPYNAAVVSHGENFAQCTKCGKVCELKQKTLEISVHDTMRLKDVPPGGR